MNLRAQDRHSNIEKGHVKKQEYSIQAPTYASAAKGNDVTTRNVGMLLKNLSRGQCKKHST